MPKTLHQRSSLHIKVLESWAQCFFSYILMSVVYPEVSNETVQITLTRRIKHALRFALKQKNFPLSKVERALFSYHAIGDEIPISTVYSLSNFLRRCHKKHPKIYSEREDAPPIYFNKLIQGATVSFHRFKPKESPIDPKSQAKLSELRARQANREYEKMVRNVTETKKDRWERETRELSSGFSQASIGINIIVSMATTLTAGYWLGMIFFNRSVTAIVCAVFLMIIVLMAEMWLFIIRADRLHKEMKKEKKERMGSLSPHIVGVPVSSEEKKNR